MYILWITSYSNRILLLFIVRPCPLMSLSFPLKVQFSYFFILFHVLTCTWAWTEFIDDLHGVVMNKDILYDSVPPKRSVFLELFHKTDCFCGCRGSIWLIVNWG